MFVIQSFSLKKFIQSFSDLTVEDQLISKTKKSLRKKFTENKRIVPRKELQCKMSSFLYAYAFGSTATIL